VLVLAAIISPFAWQLHLFGAFPTNPSLSWCCTSQPPRARPKIERQLEGIPGYHLVLIRYPVDFDIHDEWVYNAADIDNSHIIWARSLDPASDRKLVAYYRNRHLWSVDFSNHLYRLVPLCMNLEVAACGQ
jgi:hypothetical protein